jgi:hypothetical protein
VPPDSQQNYPFKFDNRGFSVHYKVFDDKIIATGWTKNMKMSEERIVAWINDMCETGLKYDCEFDGWGTTPDQ